MTQKGVTLVEMMMALSVLAVAITALLTTIASAQRANLLCEEERRALDAALAKMEEIRGRPFAQVEGAYDEDPSNDPGGQGVGSWSFYDPRMSAPRQFEGNRFALVMREAGGAVLYALDPPLDPTGSFSFPHGEVIVVREDDPDERSYANPFPVDLDGRDADGDGDPRNDNPASFGVGLGADGKSVVVVVRWRSAAARRNREVVLRTILANREGT